MSKQSHNVRRAVRERQARTGESYTRALYAVRAEVEARRVEREAEAGRLAAPRGDVTAVAEGGEGRANTKGEP
jgi:hypothetical protein